MPDPQARFEGLISKHRERDYRLTPQRVSLIRLIAASEEHPSASQLYEQVKIQYPTMSHATVYKTLSLLKDLGEVLEIPMRDDSHYDGNKPFPHPHLICLRCRRIIDGESDLAQHLVHEMERSSGYQIVRHQLDFYGICADCQDSE